MAALRWLIVIVAACADALQPHVALSGRAAPTHRTTGIVGLLPDKCETPATLNRRAVVWSAALAMLAPAVANAAADSSSVFVGRYTDPKHPGGYREITLLPGAQIGPYMLANVHGGQGTGEPESYDLPAFIVEKKEFKRITIDFSTPPKYGPPDFRGVWDPKRRGIRFYDDENFWPQQKGK